MNIYYYSIKFQIRKQFYEKFFRTDKKDMDKINKICYNIHNKSLQTVKKGMCEQMRHEKSCGAIVYRRFHGNIEILLIRHINSGHWSFPKGHIEPGETEIQTAVREIKEETAIDVMIDPTFRETVSYSPKRDTQKIVVYFIGRAKNYNFIPQEDEISEIRWVDIGYASRILTYENDKNIVIKAKNAIKNGSALC